MIPTWVHPSRKRKSLFKPLWNMIDGENRRMMDSTLARLKTAFSLQKPDRPPILGGWLAAPNHVQALTGCSEQQYYDDPYY
jgi:hypothetical protein